ncbi:MAG: endonuclease/exonuclease/phosphatase family protein [Methylococcales bacterium]|nr:endonuclease/exonuclease/phosphatase family protein [Methylococcales bacterium]MDD5631335.1 endonuclease/exonuclease/phosphatase family protein [Methylococcales bacterium]
MKKKGLRVLTYNIHKGFNISNQRFILHQIREALIHADADLLFLQEMQGKHDRHEKNVAHWPDQSQIEFIAEGVWPHFAYGKNAIYNAGHHGNAILSKHPFESWENINVSPFPWASRSLLHGVIRTRGSDQDVHIVCIHFGLMGKERRSQITTLCDRIDSHVPHDAPLIVAGDFNDWLGQAGRLFLNRLGLHEVFRETHGRYARTFPAWFPILQMDRIYYRGLIPVSCDRLTHSPWDMLSDHAPLAATFTL